MIGDILNLNLEKSKRFQKRKIVNLEKFHCNVPQFSRQTKIAKLRKTRNLVKRGNAQRFGRHKRFQCFKNENVSKIAQEAKPQKREIRNGRTSKMLNLLVISETLYLRRLGKLQIGPRSL